MIVSKAITLGIFADSVDKYDEIRIQVHNECCNIDPVFEKIDPANVKQQLYAIQRKAAQVSEERVGTLKSYEKSMRDHLLVHGALDNAFYVQDSAS